MKIKLSILFICLTQHLYGQINKKIDVSDTVPDIVFSGIINYSQEEVHLSDFKDKLIIIDFWATWCGPCITSINELELLQKEFSDKIQVIAVSIEQKGKVKSFIDKKGWQLPVVAEDTILNQMFPHQVIPHQVWIKNGIVKAVPTFFYATRQNVQAVLDGSEIKFYKKEDQEFDTKEPLLNAKEGVGLVYYSAITKRLTNQSSGRSLDNNMLLAYNQSVVDLYATAYKIPRLPYHSRMIFEIGDSLRKVVEGPGFPNMGDDNEQLNAYYKWCAENCYCYNLIFYNDDIAPQLMYEQMQDDLNKFFRIHYGVMATIEKRKVNCLILKQIKDKKENLNNEEPGLGTNRNMYVLNNKPISSFVYSLSIAQFNKNQILVADRTNIEGKINLKIRGGLDNLTTVKSELHRYGLSLIEQTQEMNMLVFRYVNK